MSLNNVDLFQLQNRVNALMISENIEDTKLHSYRQFNRLLLDIYIALISEVLFR